MFKICCLLLSSLVFSMASIGAISAQPADRIWNGTILTMYDELPRADYVAVRDGEIVGVGTGAPPDGLTGPGTEQVDLGDRAMVPGFVDAHGHVYMIGVQALSANMLPAPDGEVNSVLNLQRVLGEWAEAYPNRIEAAGFIL
ncbi:MAG TPA: amidohydrolase family protein, partial [Wenzhouxiangellaceae bacterium]|nr:amidohydrolase family protein [Wenzhouxiangellaceae bacterium]